MPLNTLGLVAGIAIAQNKGVESDQVARVALPGAILPNIALGVVVADVLATQEAAIEQQQAASNSTVGTVGQQVPGVPPAASPAGAPAAPAASGAPAAPVVAAVAATPARGGAPAGAAPAAAGNGAPPPTQGAAAVTISAAQAQAGVPATDPLPQPWSLPGVTVKPPPPPGYKPGDVLQADPGLWQGIATDAEPRFQWYRDGDEVDRNGQSSTYRIKASDEGHSLTVQVIYGDESTGYVSTTSGPIAIPKPARRRTGETIEVIEEI